MPEKLLAPATQGTGTEKQYQKNQWDIIQD